MPTRLAYAIKYVADMDAAVAFHRDQLGLPLRFASPHWTEFDTGATTLALHPATPEHAAGTCQLGFHVDDVAAFHADKSGQGIDFLAPPTRLHGHPFAKFRGSEGEECSLGGDK